MKAALLPDRGVVKVAGDDARKFLNGLLTADVGKVAPGRPAFAALLTPQGKIIADFLVVEAAPEDGGGFFLDCPRALTKTVVDRLSFYKLRAKVAVADLSDGLGVMAVWDGTGETEYGLVFGDPRLPALGARVILPPETAAEAAADLGADLVDAERYEAHRIALGVPRGGLDFAYGDAFPHDANMDQLHGVDFAKGCYVGQEVVSRMEHRGSARTRIVGALCPEGTPEDGVSITAGGKTVGTMGSSAEGRGIALVRLDRVADALAAGQALSAGGIPIALRKPEWARFAWPAAAKVS